VIQVALDVPLDKAFDFLAPDDVTDSDIGRLVLVPFGRQKMVGVITAHSATTDVAPDALKPVIAIVRDVPALSHHDLALARFLSQYYMHPLGQVLLTGMPPALRAPRVRETLAALVTRHVVLTEAGTALDVESLPARAVAQRKILLRLQQGPATRAELITAVTGAASALKTLQQKMLIRVDVVRAGIVSRSPSLAVAAGPTPNAAQQASANQIIAALGRFEPFLLFGITGSGKSEVYLQAIAETLKQNRQTLVLVPEINLTPQLEARFRERFPDTPMVSLHSHAAAKARAAAWLSAQSGHARIVLGTRLAVMTPMPALGLIIVDEEHDPSFKQQEGLRYSARDAAVYRASLVKCPVVLGSATPSLESWRNASETSAGRYNLLTLAERAVPGARLPQVRLIDTNHHPAKDGLSEPLIAALKERLQRGEQSLLFLNRRGYAPALVCSQCAWMPECRHCSARMVFHRRDGRLHCHHCGHIQPVPAHCGDCGNVDLTPLGQGTQRIEEALAHLLPDARVARMDRDATRAKGSATRIFAEAAAGRLDILVGTQMLAKGHDFPKLTLVGVLNADDAMFSADFRAPERLFAQLVQVSGRAGRAGLPGEVLIQTRFPTHALYAAAQSQDYARFAGLQLAEREAALLPPVSALALLRVESRKPGEALVFARRATELARDAMRSNGLQVHDALPATLARKAGWERAQVLVQCRSRAALQKQLPAWRAAIQAAAPRSVRWIIDVDPAEV